MEAIAITKAMAEMAAMPKSVKPAPKTMASEAPRAAPEDATHQHPGQPNRQDNLLVHFVDVYVQREPLEEDFQALLEGYCGGAHANGKRDYEEYERRG
jgi:hypothetical protein